MPPPFLGNIWCTLKVENEQGLLAMTTNPRLPDSCKPIVIEGETHESTSLESLASGLEEDIGELLYISIPLALIDEEKVEAPPSSRQ